MPLMDTDTLRRYLEFYQDLGIKDLYRRGAAAAPVQPEAPIETSVKVTPPRIIPPKDIALPPMTPQGESLLQILQDIGDCTRCRLHEKRNKLVFGVGNEKAPLVFV